MLSHDEIQSPVLEGCGGMGRLRIVSGRLPNCRLAKLKA
jgi:hypothetical protein